MWIIRWRTGCRLPARGYENSIPSCQSVMLFAVGERAERMEDKHSRCNAPLNTRDANRPRLPNNMTQRQIIFPQSEGFLSQETQKNDLSSLVHLFRAKFYVFHNCEVSALVFCRGKVKTEKNLRTGTVLATTQTRAIQEKTESHSSPRKQD